MTSAVLKQLCSNNTLTPSTPVRRLTGDGQASEWVPASSVKGLFPGDPIPPPPLPPPTASHSQPDPIASRTIRREGTRFILSSTTLAQDYDSLGLVIGFASKTEGCRGSIDVEKTYRQALDRLIESARSKSANGVIGVCFQNRVASTAACVGQQQVFEVFAWGTAVTYYDS